MNCQSHEHRKCDFRMFSRSIPCGERPWRHVLGPTKPRTQGRSTTVRHRLANAGRFGALTVRAVNNRRDRNPEPCTNGGRAKPDHASERARFIFCNAPPPIGTWTSIRLHAGLPIEKRTRHLVAGPGRARRSTAPSSPRILRKSRGAEVSGLPEYFVCGRQRRRPDYVQSLFPLSLSGRDRQPRRIIVPPLCAELTRCRRNPCRSGLRCHAGSSSPVALQVWSAECQSNSTPAWTTR